MLLGAFCGNITKAEEIKEEKIYCNATIEDNFTDNDLYFSEGAHSYIYEQYGTLQHYVNCSCGYIGLENHEWIRRPIISGLNVFAVPSILECLKCGTTSTESQI